MDFGLEVALIILAIIVFCVFLRFVIIEWKNRLLRGGYFKQNAEFLRAAAQRQREEARRRRYMARRNALANVPPPAFEEALKMSPVVYYIDVEEAAPPTYGDALKRVSETSELPTTYGLNETRKVCGNGGLILSVQDSIALAPPEEITVTKPQAHFSTITATV